MDADVLKKLQELEQKVDAIYISAEKTRKYILWTVVITLALVLLPAVGLLFAIPSMLSTYSEIGAIQ